MSYYHRSGPSDRPRQAEPTPVQEELVLNYSAHFQRDLAELSPRLYRTALRLVGGLPDRHLNDPQRLRARDSRVVTVEDVSGLRITYVIVLSLGQIIVARVDYNNPEETP